MNMRKNFVVLIGLGLLLGVFLFTTTGLMAQPAPTLDPTTIPKYVNQLTAPPVWAPKLIKDAYGRVIRQEIEISAVEFFQQLLPPGFPKTRVWGFAGNMKLPGCTTPVYSQSTPGATFEATRGIPIQVTWLNKLTGQFMFPVDPTIHWYNPNKIPMPMPPFLPFPPGYPQAQSPVAITIHLHGAETDPPFDGNPDEWFTPGGAIKGPAYVTNVYTYKNTQLPTGLWYHNHTLGVTRLSVYSGLAGEYIIRDPKDCIQKSLPSGKYEMPLVIQDRSFNSDGSLWFTQVGDNPDIHPYWDPEFFGNTIMVNGKVWPNMNVERRQYRFRVLNASNARFYHMFLSNGMSFTQIGSDGGYLPKPNATTSIMIAPAERLDLLIDFSKVAPGTKIILQNDSVAPFPSGDPADPNTTGQIMQFTVVNSNVVVPPALPQVLNVLPKFTANKPPRILALYEVEDDVTGNPLIITLNGQSWDAPTSEIPQVGSTEDWILVNLTDDAHPIHLHLVQFQLLYRQGIDRDRYTADWLALNGGGQPPFDHPTVTLPIEPYLQGNPVPPPPDESGWKDTIRAMPDTVAPGAVTRIRVRYAPQDADPAKVKPGVNLYSVDPTLAPGYLWHCHILDHEDNDMMRRYKVVK